MVRRQLARLVRVWPGLTTSRRKRFATPSIASRSSICSSETREPFCWDTPTRHRTSSSSSKSSVNCDRIERALRALGFELTAGHAQEVRRGKDLIQLKNGPFDLDLVFAPDGIERFEDAWQRRVDVQGFHVCSIDDIVESKRATNPQKDRESLPRLLKFRDWLKNQS